MSTLDKNLKSAFDYSELTAELEIPVKKRQSIKPLKTGKVCKTA
jgi:hypothetical protein